MRDRVRLSPSSTDLPDQMTMRSGLEGPGVDTRQWVSYGIVDEETADEKSVVWPTDGDPEDGDARVRVTLQPSAIPVLCRVASYVAGNLEGEWYPYVQGDEVIVVIPEGDERASPVIVGRLNNGTDRMPTTVAGNDVTKNAVGFRRMRAPYLVETSSSYLIRSAKTGAFLGIKDDGSVTLGEGSGGSMVLSPDAVGFQTDKDGTDVLQIDPKNHIFLVGLNAGDDALVVGGDTPGIRSQSPFYVAAGGAPAVFHAATVEGVANLLVAIGAVMAPPLTPAQIAGAIATAATAPLLPAVAAAVQAALASAPPPAPITDPLSAAAALAAAAAKPGIGSPYLSIA